jgi:hypothetical protein
MMKKRAFLFVKGKRINFCYPFNASLVAFFSKPSRSFDFGKGSAGTGTPEIFHQFLIGKLDIVERRKILRSEGAANLFILAKCWGYLVVERMKR